MKVTDSSIDYRMGSGINQSQIGISRIAQSESDHESKKSNQTACLVSFHPSRAEKWSNKF